MQEIKNENGQKYIYDSLTDKILDICNEVYNVLGSGYKESYYEKCIAVKLRMEKVSFKTQVSIPLIYEEERIGFRRLDFLLEDRLVVELKIGSGFSQANFVQVLEYLKFKNLKLGLIILFSSTGVKVRRVVNL